MTLEQASSQALHAALAGNLDALRHALNTRSRAIAALEAKPEMRGRIEQALRAGEEISGAIFALKQRLRFAATRLAQLEAGLRAGCAAASPNHLNSVG